MYPLISSGAARRCPSSRRALADTEHVLANELRSASLPTAVPGCRVSLPTAVLVPRYQGTTEGAVCWYLPIKWSWRNRECILALWFVPSIEYTV